ADLLVGVGVSFCLYALVRRPLGLVAGAGAAAWYAALYLRGDYWGLAQAESFANLFLVAAALAGAGAARSARPTAWFALAGAAIGVAADYKITSLLPGLVILVWGLAGCPAGSPSHGPGRVRARGFLKGALAAALAGAAILMLAVAWMAATGCLRDYLEIQERFVRPYAALPPVGPHAGLWPSLRRYAREDGFPLVLAAVG